MNEFEIGQKVVLVEGHYLNELETVLAEEKHLFEVLSWGYDGVNLKSVRTDLKVRVYVENVRPATLKEQYLRTGNVVELERGDIRIVIKDRLVGLEGFIYTDNYDRNLQITSSSLKELNIIKVYQYDSGMSGSINQLLKIGNYHRIIWERKPKIKLTDDEIVILKNIDGIYKYIARDKDDDELYVYKYKPGKSLDYYVGDYLTNVGIFNHLFQNITFESGSHLIADLIKENEK